MLYLMTHSTHFISCYMASHVYSFRLAARVLVYASSHIHDNTYHCLCYTSRGILAGTRNSSMGRNTSKRFYHGDTKCNNNKLKCPFNFKCTLSRRLLRIRNHWFYLKYDMFSMSLRYEPCLTHTIKTGRC